MIYVGEWEGQTKQPERFGLTSSNTFQWKLSSEFTCTERLNFRIMCDDLSVGNGGSANPEHMRRRARHGVSKEILAALCVSVIRLHRGCRFFQGMVCALGRMAGSPYLMP